jgi:HK97 family phage major capsid protein
LEDAAFDVGAELTQDFAEAFAAVEGTAFISGDSTKGRPEGILRAPNVPTVASGAATSVTVDALIAMALDLPAIFRSRATWAMNRSTLSVLARAKTGDGAYILQQALQVGQKGLLLGLPWIECPDLPDLGAGSKSIVLGDWSRYRIFDKPSGTQILRDPYSQATSGIVRFHGRRRVGATLTMPSAYRVMVTGV